MLKDITFDNIKLTPGGHRNSCLLNKQCGFYTFFLLSKYFNKIAIHNSEKMELIFRILKGFCLAKIDISHHVRSMRCTKFSSYKTTISQKLLH